MFKLSSWMRVLAVLALVLVASGAPRSVNGAPPAGPGSELDPAILQRSIPAVVEVLILAQVTKDGKQSVVVAGNGSGTVIDPRGYILTNHHVTHGSATIVQAAKKQDPSINAQPVDYMAVAFTDDPKQPPVPKFIAKSVAEDREHDVAVIQIQSDLNGNPVAPNSLHLPTIPIGDSDSVHIGDTIYEMGYPGFAGSTITFDAASVQGFLDKTEGSYQDEVGGVYPGEGMVKTDANEGPGVSGGTALNQKGELIGIPSMGSSPGEGSGGHVFGGVREVNYAKSTIAQALSGVTPVGPTPGPNNSTPAPQGTPGPQPTAGPNGPTPGPQPTQQANGQSGFGNVTLAEDVDQQGNPKNPGTSFPSGITHMSALWQYQNVPSGAPWGYSWSVDGQVVVNKSNTWNASSPSGTYVTGLQNNGGALPDGQYKFQLMLNGQTVQTASATVGGGSSNQPTPPPTSGVNLKGTAVDAVTNQPISGGTFLVLNEGVDVNKFANDNYAKSDVMELVTTDRNGVFQTNVPLQRGHTYSMILLAQGYQPVIFDKQQIQSNWPDLLDIGTVQMQQKTNG